MFGKITRRKTDILFSQYLRKLRNYTCERCGKREEGKMQCSHFWGRKAESVRFDGENIDVLCFPCHNYFEMNPAEYTIWKEKQLGEKRYKMLMVRAHTYQKRDDKKMLIALKFLLKE